MRLGNKHVSGIFVWDNIIQNQDTYDAVEWEADDIVIFPGGIYRATRNTFSTPDTSTSWEHIIAANCTVDEFLADSQGSSESSLSNKFVTAKVVRDSLYGDKGILNFMTSSGGTKRWTEDVGNINKTSVYICTSDTPNKPGISDIGIVKTTIPEIQSDTCLQEYLDIQDDPLTSGYKVISVRYRTGTNMGNNTISWQSTWSDAFTSYGISKTTNLVNRIVQDYQTLLEYFKNVNLKHIEIEVNDPNISYSNFVNEDKHVSLIKILVNFEILIGGNNRMASRWVDIYLDEIRNPSSNTEFSMLFYVGKSTLGDLYLTLTNSRAYLSVNGAEISDNSKASIVKYLGFTNERQ